MRTEKISGFHVRIDGGNAEMSIECQDCVEIQDCIDNVLNKHEDWIVGKLDFRYKDGLLSGKVGFSLPVVEKPPRKNKRISR
jgi:hypothetical protein